jgi:hypothetical protein
MTLIVGFRCADAAVLCADSQETRAGLKSEVNKLQIQAADTGGMDIVCGGAGNGELYEAFRVSVLARMKCSATIGEEPIRQELEAALVAFHRGRVFLAYPASQEDKLIAGLIAVRSVSREVFIYRFFGPVIQPVHTYGLAGEDSHIATQNELFDALRFDLSSTEDQAKEKLRNFSNSITAVRGVYGSKYPAWPSPSFGKRKPPNDDKSE